MKIKDGVQAFVKNAKEEGMSRYDAFENALYEADRLSVEGMRNATDVHNVQAIVSQIYGPAKFVGKTPERQVQDIVNAWGTFYRRYVVSNVQLGVPYEEFAKGIDADLADISGFRKFVEIAFGERISDEALILLIEEKRNMVDEIFNEEGDIGRFEYRVKDK